MHFTFGTGALVLGCTEACPYSGPRQPTQISRSRACAGASGACLRCSIEAAGFGKGMALSLLRWKTVLLSSFLRGRGASSLASGIV